MNTPDNLVCDHIDYSGLNNQEYNLRNCTQHQNNMHGKELRLNYLGVSYYYSKYKDKVYTYIRARIKVNGKTLHLGHFSSNEEAAKAYDEAAKQYFGEFANLNFK
jgi:hypothetical protein